MIIEQRQAYALAHPVNDPREVLAPAFQQVRKHPRGFSILTILAVDR